MDDILAKAILGIEYFYPPAKAGGNSKGGNLKEGNSKGGNSKAGDNSK